MTVKEFYDYITKHMSAEEALMKLLEGSVIQYEKLKFDEQEKAVHPLLIIPMAAMDMGWMMSIERDEEDNIKGISVGTEDYIEGLYPSKEPNP